MSRIIISFIRVYQRILSPETGSLWVSFGKTKKVCVFFPSCSEYTIHTIEKYGVIRGVFKGIKRIFRCHPWQKRRYDPVE
ncbi:MAG: membrane protein insertion efficiency factor YidD [Candidatus Yonathbacteria bacterium CG_4_10_14_3_um_filter_47_65]|uniref:Putative membrane protein insertion efficiency factor n=1 Tax=Candidatus Yonathbacteria bacterium CG_4_9_14_0_8_um_filter_46_47 TaxID=1975106 RepID=A0A2M8D5H8_9BACT|nr:MAG: membrane protein insertion efficiency factor YidD [Candidatus Yonathbacteria bacterium CG23_combo_of_CG06-09_8_20_14_all_46_18]PIQ32784.1 MAG: membrane protein insertion efficiency factor YidD [Candidatus Yonathbacteria bacterium CG17_big_fil_post_rev_8_21_14_2_50_46_19]PIX56323.1 MAG: membrane protein insertion efficiency factor YidD [Candidatus Yonathbacteria bacterium CG_4_10_14_3_um_filter_47_65]PIY57332.1 MAG: membrane protein insertion efficiency factor YidD [Candidatus Yonathbacte